VLFISGSLLRFCTLPEDGQSFAGIGRHPNSGEKLLLTIHRDNQPGGKARHQVAIVPLALTPPGGASPGGAGPGGFGGGFNPGGFNPGFGNA